MTFTVTNESISASLFEVSEGNEKGLFSWLYFTRNEKFFSHSRNNSAVIWMIYGSLQMFHRGVNYEFFFNLFIREVNAEAIKCPIHIHLLDLEIVKKKKSSLSFQFVHFSFVVTEWYVNLTYPHGKGTVWFLTPCIILHSNHFAWQHWVALAAILIFRRSRFMHFSLVYFIRCLVTIFKNGPLETFSFPRR